MVSNSIDLLKPIETYYSQKLAEYGLTPNGVDWNGEKSQNDRFKELTKVIDPTLSQFSLNDVGCGYGALIAYILSHYEQFVYHGIDISHAMIEAAQVVYKNNKNISFSVSNKLTNSNDYSIASGIFNVKLGTSSVEWLNYIESTLDNMNHFSKLGFSFNCLTKYSDEEKMRPHLYYADPCLLFDMCKRKYSKQVALLHDYGLYEFTILVRK